MPTKPIAKIKLTLPVLNGLTDSELKDSHFRKKYGEGLPTLRSSGKTNTRFVTYGKGKRFFGIRYVCYGCDTLFVTEGWAYRTKTDVAYICSKCKPLIVNLADVDLLNISTQGGKVNRK
jgi:hypothetical protein